MEAIHIKWENGECSHGDVMMFAEHDMNLLGYQEAAYKGSWIVRVRDFLVGEKGRIMNKSFMLVFDKQNSYVRLLNQCKEFLARVFMAYLLT